MLSRTRTLLLALATQGAAWPTPVHTALTPQRVLQVGPTRALKQPSEAAAVAEDGDVIEIDAGTYLGDVAVWRQSNLTLRGVGGRAHLEANGQDAQGKAIWVIQGNDTLVENIEFSGATVSDENGAGIRQEGSGLTVRNCYFHDNENGILGGAGAASDIVVEYSEFANNGFGDGYSHNLYILNARTFTFRYSYSHHAKIGHNIKSRARTNFILYSRIMDEQTGTASYAIDLPDGGASYVVGNLIQQGPETDNSSIIAYAAESQSNPAQELYLVNNTVVNERPSGGTFVQVSGTSPIVLLVNNILSGPGNVSNRSVLMLNNLLSVDPMFVDANNFDYRLRAGSPAIDAGIAPGLVNGVDLTPQSHYVHVANREPRPVAGTIDIGAYEFTGAELINPPPGGELPGPNVTFEWSAGAQVLEYWLYLGNSVGASDLFDSGSLGLSRSVAVTGLATDGRPIFARLFFRYTTGWTFRDAEYRTKPQLMDPVILSPVPGSTLSGPSATLEWSAGEQASEYWASIGNRRGGGDLFDRSVGTSLSVTVANLPTDGRPLYVRLWFLRAGKWLSADFEYTAFRASTPADPVITGPEPGSTLTDTAATFEWAPGGQNSEYWLYLGSSRGASDIVDSGSLGTKLSVSVAGLPADGRAIFARLWFRRGTVWLFTDYNYTATRAE